MTNWHRKIWNIQKANPNPPGDPVPDNLYEDDQSNQFWLDCDVGTTEEETADGTALQTATRAGFRVHSEPEALAEGWNAGWLLLPKGKNPYDPNALDLDTERLEGIAVIRGVKKRLRLYSTVVDGKEALVIRLGIPCSNGSQGLAVAYP
jgi:hypothetical protein